jgi:hypothetical protein
MAAMHAIDEINPARDETSRPLPDADIGPAIREPRLRRLFDYWNAKRGTRRFPARRDVAPAEFSYALGSIMLVDVLGDPPRFKVRLHGSTMAMRAGYDMTGRMLDELPESEYRAYVLARCRGLLADGRPLVTAQDRILDDRVWRYEALWLPFADDDSKIDLLLCALIYTDSARRPEPPLEHAGETRSPL